jgi:hypothetical protein
MYTSMLGKERKQNQDKVDRYQNGCDKLKSTNEIVETLQQEIIKLQPVLEKAGKETAELIEVVTKDKASASVVQVLVFDKCRLYEKMYRCCMSSSSQILKGCTQESDA